MLTLVLGAVLISQPVSREFEVQSKDGTIIHGQVDKPAKLGKSAIIMVAGTGLFDRDVRFGRSNTDRDLIFKDLAGRMTAKGATVIRYDRRGVRYGVAKKDLLDVATAGTSTVETQRDDLAAVYDWVRSSKGLNMRCVVLFGHSEGMAHIGRLASAGAKAPAMVFGVGALMESPAAVMRWQVSGRDAQSLRMMDLNKDGQTTNAEVQANWRKTPSSWADRPDLLQNPSGAWSSEAIDAVVQTQTLMYDQAKVVALAAKDDAPYPNSTTPMARYSWWKSWFTDDVPIAKRLAAWHVPVRLHYGDIDSQTPPDRQLSAAAALGVRPTTTVHPGRGHTLGEHATAGPMDEALANLVASEAADPRVCR